MVAERGSGEDRDILPALLQRQLESLLQVVDLEVDGRVVEPAVGEGRRATGSSADEFIWRFAVASRGGDEAAADRGGAGGERLTTMVREQLAALLEVCVLTYRGQRVRVDGFQFLQDSSPVHDLYPVRSDDACHTGGLSGRGGG